MKKLVLIACLFFTISSITYANSIHSDVVAQGEEGQVSSIIGNGTAGQGDYTTDHPRDLDFDTNGVIYFIDGDHEHAKLRKFDGTKNSTVVDLAKSPLMHRSKMFVDTGLANVGDTLFVSSYQGFYKAVDNRITAIEKVNNILKENKVEYLYRTKRDGNKIILMCWGKAHGGSYSFYTFDPVADTVETLLDDLHYDFSPNSFYKDSDGILLTLTGGLIFYEKFFPRKTIQVMYNGNANILDSWASASGYLHYSLVDHGGTENRIMRIPRSSEDMSDKELVAGSNRGFFDGFADEVQMDFAQSFVWDGSGIIFADKNSNAIRKLWTTDKPTNQ